MCTFTTNALLLCSLLTVVTDSSRGETLHVPPDVQVLSPSEFRVVLSPEEKGTLRKIRIGINEQIGFGEREAEYERTKPIGRIIPFSDGHLNLKKGDTVYYSLVFTGGDHHQYGQTGMYVFDGVYKDPSRRRREVYEPSSEENSGQTPKEKDISQDSSGLKQSRYLRRGHGPPPHGRFHHHGPPHQFHFEPRPFDSPPFGYPPPPGPGSWRDHGHDRRDPYDHRHAWDDHDDCEYGNKPKRPGGNQGPGHNRPWNGGNGDNPYGNNNGGHGDNPYYNNKPNNNGKGTNKPILGSDDNSSSSTERTSNNNSRTTENPNAEVFTTRRTNSTQSTSTTIVPDIDIRLRVPEER